MLLLCDYYGRPDVLNVFQHEDRVLLGILELLEQEQRFFIIA